MALFLLEKHPVVWQGDGQTGSLGPFQKGTAGTDTAGAGLQRPSGALYRDQLPGYSQGGSRVPRGLSRGCGHCSNLGRGRLIGRPVRWWESGRRGSGKRDRRTRGIGRGAIPGRSRHPRAEGRGAESGRLHLRGRAALKRSLCGEGAGRAPGGWPRGTGPAGSAAPRAGPERAASCASSAPHRRSRREARRGRGRASRGPAGCGEGARG